MGRTPIIRLGSQTARQTAEASVWRVRCRLRIGSAPLGQLHSKLRFAPSAPHASRSQVSKTIEADPWDRQLRCRQSRCAVPSATKRRQRQLNLRDASLPRHRGQISYFVIHGPLSTSRRRLYRCVNSAAQTAPARTTRNQIIFSCYVMLRAMQPDGI